MLVYMKAYKLITFVAALAVAASAGLATPSAHADLLASDGVSVKRYDATGVFQGDFVPAGSGGLATPSGLVFGPDGNLYVSSRLVSSFETHAVLRYQGPAGASPGAFIDAFVPAVAIEDPASLFDPIGLAARSAG